MLANEGQEMDEDMIYIQKMELGLFTLQQVMIILPVILSGNFAEFFLSRTVIDSPELIFAT